MRVAQSDEVVSISNPTQQVNEMNTETETEIKVVKSDKSNPFQTKDFQVNFTRAKATYVQSVTKKELLELVNESITALNFEIMKENSSHTKYQLGFVPR